MFKVRRWDAGGPGVSQRRVHVDYGALILIKGPLKITYNVFWGWGFLIIIVKLLLSWHTIPPNPCSNY